MEIEEMHEFNEYLKKWGGSYILVVNEDLLEYLKIEKPKDGEEIKIRLMADNGKHGRFISFWKIKE